MGRKWRPLSKSITNQSSRTLVHGLKLARHIYGIPALFGLYLVVPQPSEERQFAENTKCDDEASVNGNVPPAPKRFRPTCTEPLVPG